MPTEPKVIAVIPARWESSRFPGKPLALISGRPMIHWVAEQASKSQLVSEVIVATDDSRIYESVSRAGWQVVMTSTDHASGTDRIVEVVEDMDCDIIVNVQGDEPMIPPENIDLVVQALQNEPNSPVSTLMIAITDRDEMLNPNTTKVVVDQMGQALYFSRAPIPFDRDGETAEPSGAGILGYKHIGLYAYRKSFIQQFPKLQSSQLEQSEKLEQLRILDNGFSIKVVETKHNSIGVDCEADRVKVEEHLKQQQTSN
jgi:3-deoxy-manno-octulosonate cytidylyltransferase (CMP-KDO synthetase)